MKPKKQPNGKYKLRIYDYTDSNGKMHMKSFTAWSKSECIEMANAYKSQKTQGDKDFNNMLFKDACELFVSSRTNILSPATIKKYRFMQRNFQFFDGFKLKDIDSSIIQEYVNNISTSLSYKSVKDRYAFLTSILASYRPSVTFSVVLPRKVKTSRYLPKNEEVVLCINSAKDPMFKLAICLGAYGMMRAGEICAFEKSDLDGNTLHIHRNMVKGIDGYVIKSPKTYESDRYVPLPNFVVDMINDMPTQTIGLNPNSITNRWNRLLNKLELPHFRFHDLRGYCCSTYHDRGVPNAITQKIGGWSNSATMENIYRQAIESSIARQTGDINKYFEELNKHNFEDTDRV